MNADENPGINEQSEPQHTGQTNEPVEDQPPPQAPEAPQAPSEPEPIAHLLCPSCDASLRNVLPGPTGKIHCLNCGHSFAHPNQTEFEKKTSSAGPQPKKHQKANAAKYTLLRIVGLINFILSVAAGLFLLIVYLLSPSMGGGLNVIVPVLFIAIIPWNGWFFYYLPKTMDLLDEAHTSLAENFTTSAEAPLRPPGSSLPYILPSSVIGNVGALILLAVSTNRSGNSDAIIFPLVISFFLGGGGLLLGFIFESIRLFLWRQTIMAQRMNRAQRHSFSQNEKLPWSFLGITVLVAPISYGLMLLFIMTKSYLYRQADVGSISTYIGIAALHFIPWSVCLLARAFDLMVTEWERARFSMNAPIRERSPVLRAIARLPLWWIGLGVVQLFLLLIDSGPSLFRISFQLEFFFGCTSLCGLAISLSLFLKRMHQWRHIQNAIIAHQTSNARLKRADPFLPSGLGFAFLLPIILAAIGLSILFLSILGELSNIFSTIWIIFPIWVIAGLIYPHIWLTFIARECMLANQATLIKKGAKKETLNS